MQLAQILQPVRSPITVFTIQVKVNNMCWGLKVKIQQFGEKQKILRGHSNE